MAHALEHGYNHVEVSQEAEDEWVESGRTRIKPMRGVRCWERTSLRYRPDEPADVARAPRGRGGGSSGSARGFRAPPLDGGREALPPGA